MDVEWSNVTNSYMRFLLFTDTNTTYYFQDARLQILIFTCQVQKGGILIGYSVKEQIIRDYV